MHLHLYLYFMDVQDIQLAAIAFNIELLSVSEQWLVWVKPMKMLPTACGYSPTLNLVPTANPPSRKMKAAITCSAQRSVQNCVCGQKRQSFKCLPTKLWLSDDYQLILCGLMRSNVGKCIQSVKKLLITYVWHIY